MATKLERIGISMGMSIGKGSRAEQAEHRGW